MHIPSDFGIVSQKKITSRSHTNIVVHAMFAPFSIWRKIPNAQIKSLSSLLILTDLRVDRVKTFEGRTAKTNSRHTFKKLVGQ